MTFLNRHRSRIRPVGPFAPSSLFFGGIPGAWYDPTDLSTMFQDSTGTTPVTAVEQPVGRILDKSGNGNHASQSTAASRPTYRARYNLLTYSEQFNDASWTKQNTTTSANTTVAPDGTTTADTLVETAVNAAHLTYQTITAIIGARYTFSCYAKAAQRSYVALQIYNNVSNARFTALFDIVGGTVVTTRTSNAPTGTSASITSVGNGWWRIQITMDQVGGTQNIPQIALSDSATPTFAADLPSYLGDGTSGAFIWGAQLLTAADVTATGNAYQRIAASTVYDTAPIFRPYLAFDGLDDSLSTAAINFTATDKMSVFSGLAKNTDATTYQLVAELSASVNTNNGAFALWAPGQVVAGGGFEVSLRGTSLAGYAPSGYAAPINVTLTALLDIGAATLATEIVPRVNGTVVQTTPSGGAGTGNFGTYPLFIGRRNNASLPFNGRIYELIVRGAASSVTEIADTELWVNARTGAY